MPNYRAFRAARTVLKDTRLTLKLNVYHHVTELHPVWYENGFVRST